MRSQTSAAELSLHAKLSLGPHWTGPVDPSGSGRPVLDRRFKGITYIKKTRSNVNSTFIRVLFLFERSFPT